MNDVTTALDRVVDLFWRFLAFLLSGMAFIENWLRSFMQQAGLPKQVQTIILVVAALLLFVAAFRLLGGFLRILVILFLVLLAVQLFGPVGSSRRFGEARPGPAAMLG